MLDEEGDREQEDSLALIRAQIDQAKAILPEQASFFFSVYTEYKAAGFSSEEAFTFVMAMFHNIIGEV